MTTWINQSSTEKSSGNSEKAKGRLLVVVGTYSIGKERIVMGIAKALGTKIYAPMAKRRICGCLEDEVLMGMMTDDPREGQVHMTRYVSLFVSVLQDSLTKFLDFQESTLQTQHTPNLLLWTHPLHAVPTSNL
jgi:DNA cross-link repair 1A protein